MNRRELLRAAALPLLLPIARPSIASAGPTWREVVDRAATFTPWSLVLLLVDHPSISKEEVRQHLVPRGFDLACYDRDNPSCLWDHFLPGRDQGVLAVGSKGVVSSFSSRAKIHLLGQKYPVWVETTVDRSYDWGGRLLSSETRQISTDHFGILTRA